MRLVTGLTVESSRSFWPVWQASDFQAVENKGLTETTIRDNWIPKIFQNQTVRRTFHCQVTGNSTEHLFYCFLKVGRAGKNALQAVAG
jgi:hypothetical protein